MTLKKTTITAAGVAEGNQLIGTPTDPNVALTERIKALIAGSMSVDVYNGWGDRLFRDDVELISASSDPGRTVFRFTVKPSLCNRLGNLHGGCIATLFDFATTCALAPIVREGFWIYAGVSRSLNITYIRPAPVGETVLIESEVVHVGKRLCSLKGVMRSEKDGRVMATCEHGKVNIDPEARGKL